jgi:chromosome segregation ATPase
MNNNIIKDSIECLANAKLNDTTYEVARDIVLDYITNLQERIAYLERSNNRREDTILGQRQELADLQEELEHQKEMELEYNDKHTKLMQKYSDLQKENERLLKQLEDISLDEANIRADVLLEAKICNEETCSTLKRIEEERERLIKAWETVIGDFEKEYAKNERAKEVYIKALIEANNRGEDMPLVAVEMYNILEENK